MTNITLLEAGALGSKIALQLADFCPYGSVLSVYDDDTIEAQNVSVSAFFPYQKSKLKAVVLANMVTRKSDGNVTGVANTKTLSRQLNGTKADLVIDTFDNFQSRSLSVGLAVPTVHIGLSGNRGGQVVWGDGFQIPVRLEWTARGENPVCTHHLGMDIVNLVAAMGGIAIRGFLVDGWQRNVVITPRFEVIF